MRPFELTLTDAAAAVRAKELSPVELTESVLGRARAVEGRLNAFVGLRADEARRAAATAEAEIAAGRYRGPLHGVPIALTPLEFARRSRRLYLSYTDLRGDLRIEEWRASRASPDRADRSTRRLVLRIPQPRPTHTGGNLPEGAPVVARRRHDLTRGARAPGGLLGRVFGLRDTLDPRIAKKL